MAKSKTIFSCQKCGAQYPKWQGQCQDCQSWNTLVEEIFSKPSSQKGGEPLKPKEILTLDHNPESTPQSFRKSTGLKELDRVLGGGLVQGSYVLLGGEPGIGKSTLLLQMSVGLSEKVLYISAEESSEQILWRAKRLGLKSSHVEVCSESQLENLLKICQEKKPKVVIVDSIQTVFVSDLSSAPGSVSQVRETAGRLMSLAKSHNISVLLIGHINKEGHLAGPKVLEHMVDTVLSFEGDRQFRLLRSLKNRFGATHELGVFEMSSKGLKEVENPSEFFLSERAKDPIGSAVFAALEGSRPVLCEVQALSISSKAILPRRTSLGLDSNRIHLLTAVLERHLNLRLSQKDIFINIVGGLKISEPACDLAVLGALLSSEQHKPLPHLSCFLGEVGLTGEVRAVSFLEQRITEAQKLGFKTFVLPHSNQKHLSTNINSKNLNFFWIQNIKELLTFFKQELHETNSKAKNSELGF